MKITNKDYTDLEQLSKLEKNESFLSQWAALLAKIPLVMSSKGKINIAETVKNIPQIEGISPSVIRSFIKGQHSTYFSKYFSGKSATFNQAVPIVLYAHKRYNDIPYMAWEGDPLVSYIMPPLFGEFPEWDFEDSVSLFTKDDSPITVEEARIRMVTDSSRVRHPFSAYKCNNIGNQDWDSIPKFYRSMRMQLWIFAAGKRNKWMILNWSDWDNMPEPMDTVNTAQEVADTDDFWNSVGGVYKEKHYKIVKDDKAPWN